MTQKEPSADGKSIDAEMQSKLLKLHRDFALQITHDLKAPLTSIRASIAMVLRGDLGAVTEDQKRFLSVAEVNTLRMAEMINEVLDFSCIEAGELRVYPEPARLEPILENATHSFSAWVQNARLTLSLEMDLHLLPVMADTRRIHQVLGNLLSNAIKYTPAQGRIICRAHWIKASDGLPSKWVRVEVEDTGRGISPEAQARIFDKFEQGRRYQEEKASGGSGLGLYIAREIIALHQGEIGVKSVPGVGSTFWFTLPLSKTAPEGSRGGFE